MVRLKELFLYLMLHRSSFGLSQSPHTPYTQLLQVGKVPRQSRAGCTFAQVTEGLRCLYCSDAEVLALVPSSRGAYLGVWSHTMEFQSHSQTLLKSAW